MIDQVNNANSAIIFLINQDCQSGSVGQSGPGGPGGVGSPGGPGGRSDQPSWYAFREYMI